MNKSEIEKGVVEILEAVLNCSISTSISRSNRAEWDSLKHMQIIFAVEDKFSIRFADEQIPQLNSLSNIIESVIKNYES